MPSPQYDNLVQMFKAQREAATSPSIPELRKGFEMLGQMMPPPADTDIEPVDCNGVPAERFVTPGSDPSRCVLYLHGGGYCIGSLATHRHVVAKIAAASGAPALNIDYRLAPEHPHPAAVDDALTAYRWLLDHGSEPESIAITGDSAGGGLTVALQIAIRDAGLGLPAASSPHSPYVDLETLGEVSDEALDMDYLRPEQIALFQETYVPQGDRKAPLVSPVHADLSGLPPMLIQAGGSEILLDSARRLAARAKDCGVDVTLEIEPGLFHAWHLFAGVLPEADETIARVGSFFKDHWS